MPNRMATITRKLRIERFTEEENSTPPVFFLKHVVDFLILICSATKLKQQILRSPRMRILTANILLVYLLLIDTDTY